VAKFLNPDALGVPGSCQNWILGAVTYIACWIIWIFDLMLGYELIYSFYCCWCFHELFLFVFSFQMARSIIIHSGCLLILPIYLSSPAFNLVSMMSYMHFCFLQHICSSAFPHVNSSVILPSTEGLLCDVLTETCYIYAQNLPTIVTLLLHAGLALVLLLMFFSPEHLPGGLSLSDIDQSIMHHDGMFFNTSTGTLSSYAKGVLIDNAAWAAWRTLVLLLSWYVPLPSCPFVMKLKTY
jgi:hypothetical protein